MPAIITSGVARLIVPSRLAIKIRPVTEDVNNALLDMEIYFTLLKHYRKPIAIKVTTRNILKKAKCVVSAMHTIVYHIVQDNAKCQGGRSHMEVLGNALVVVLDKYEQSLKILEIVRGLARRGEELADRAQQEKEIWKMSCRKRSHSEFIRS